MNYYEIHFDARGIFLKRLNRFVGLVDITWPFGEEKVKIHIHDSGRLSELLFAGNEILLKKPEREESRKTKWDLVAAKFDNQWVLTNSGLHRKIAEWIFARGIPFGELKSITPEIKRGNSRLDFLLKNSSDERIWVETKGCTLALNGRAIFPDAPTERGKRHVEELIELRRSGERAAIVFLVMRRDSLCFYPNIETDPEFSKSFFKAIAAGVEVYSLLFEFTPPKLIYKHQIPMCK